MANSSDITSENEDVGSRGNKYPCDVCYVLNIENKNRTRLVVFNFFGGVFRLRGMINSIVCNQSRKVSKYSHSMYFVTLAFFFTLSMYFLKQIFFLFASLLIRYGTWILTPIHRHLSVYNFHVNTLKRKKKREKERDI